MVCSCKCGFSLIVLTQQKHQSRKIPVQMEAYTYTFFLVVIPSTTAYKDDGRRNVNKLHCCVFCGKLDTRIARHLRSHKRDQEIIKQLDDMDEKEVQSVLNKLRLEGDTEHNRKVVIENKGFLILTRRPSTKDEQKYSIEDYLPCPHCKELFLKNNLWRHSKRCGMAEESGHTNGRRPVQQRGARLLQSWFPPPADLKEGFVKNVLETLILYMM